MVCSVVIKHLCPIDSGLFHHYTTRPAVSLLLLMSSPIVLMILQVFFTIDFMTVTISYTVIKPQLMQLFIDCVITYGITPTDFVTVVLVTVVTTAC